MTEQEIKDIVTRQRKYFYTGATLPVSTRLTALQKLYNAISEHETEIHDALKKDLGKSGFESYMCETKESGHRWRSFIPGAIRSRRRMG